MPRRRWLEPPEVWDAEIRALEAAARAAPRAPGAIVFTGSSSIRMWSTLARDMAPLPVLNRGFGGAQMHQVLHFAPRLVLPPRPRAVVLSAGENDLESRTGKQPRDVLAELTAFAALLAEALPAARLYVLSIKPSPARRARWAAARRYNALLPAFVAADPRRALVDVTTPAFDARGHRRRELYLDDGLHLSPAGYALWTSILRPRLLADLGGAAAPDSA